MKQLRLFVLIILSFLSVSLFANNTKTELAIGGSYSKSILTGASKKMNARAELMLFKEVPKLTDWEYGYGLGAQYNQKKDITTIIPAVSLRYYPFNFFTSFVETYAGVPLNMNDQNFGWKIGAAVGVGRDGVVAKTFVDLTDGKVIDSKGDVANVGVMLGYRF